MKKYLILSLALMMLVATSCATYNAPTRYQGRNLYKFTHKKRTYNAGKARKAKFIVFKKRVSYHHPAIPKEVRRYLRARNWLDNVGAGQLYK